MGLLTNNGGRFKVSFPPHLKCPIFLDLDHGIGSAAPL